MLYAFVLPLDQSGVAYTHVQYLQCQIDKASLPPTTRIADRIRSLSRPTHTTTPLTLNKCIVTPLPASLPSGSVDNVWQASLFLRDRIRRIRCIPQIGIPSSSTNAPLARTVWAVAACCLLPCGSVALWPLWNDSIDTNSSFLALALQTSRE